MNSKITIEIDFENQNRPVIQIIHRNSDDVRDKLISSFLQSLHGLRWCSIQWVGGTVGDPTQQDQFSRIHIAPITDDNIKEEFSLMKEAVSERIKS